MFLSCIISETLSDIGWKSLIFHTQPAFNAAVRNDPSEFCHDVLLLKNRMTAVKPRKKFCGKFSHFFDTTYDSGGQRDVTVVAYTVLAWNALRGKKSHYHCRRHRRCCHSHQSFVRQSYTCPLPLRSWPPREHRGSCSPWLSTLSACVADLQSSSETYTVNWRKLVFIFFLASLVSLRVTTLQTMWNSLTIPRHFPDGSRHSSAGLGMLGVVHIMPVLVLLSVVGVGMQQYMIRNHILNI